MQGLILHAGANRIGRQELRELRTPEPTDTHKPVPHAELVQATIEALDYRKIEVVQDEYGVTPDGMRMFGFLGLNIERDGFRLGIALRNSHDKSFSLGMVAGYRVFVCDNLAFNGEFAGLTRKHSKHLDIVETIALGVDRVQRNFQKIEQRVNAFQNFQLSDANAKAIMFDAFVQGDLDIGAKHLGPVVAQHYFEPPHDEFKPRTLWSLENAFTEAFKELEPVKFFTATAALAPFLQRYH